MEMSDFRSDRDFVFRHPLRPPPTSAGNRSGGPGLLWLCGVGVSAPGHNDAPRRRESNGMKKRRQVCRPLKTTECLVWAALGGRTPLVNSVINEEPRPPRLPGAQNVMAHLANWEGRNRPRYLKATEGDSRRGLPLYNELPRFGRSRGHSRLMVGW
jgi:hypothetical protein